MVFVHLVSSPVEIVNFLARSRALKPGLIRFFFHLEQYFPLTDSSSIPPNHPNSSRIPPSEQALEEFGWFGGMLEEFVREK